MAVVEIIFRGRDDASDDARKVADSIQGIDGAARNADSSSKGLLGTLGGFGGPALAGVTALAAGIGGAAFAGLNFNNSIEQVTAKLNAFTKDGEATAEILEMIKTRAAETPFEFNAMAEAAAALMPAAKMSGEELEGLIAQAEILAASNPAQGLEGAAFALKEAISGDFTSVIERFNLSRSYINQLREEGVPNLQAVSMAMQQLGLDSDLVTSMAGTLEGRWSTMLDTFTMLAGQVTQPIFDLASQGIAQFNGFLEENEAALNAFAQNMATNVAGAIATIQAYWPQIQAGIQAAIGYVQQGITFITGLFSQGSEGPNTWSTAFTQAQAIVGQAITAIQGIVSAVVPIITQFWAEHGTQIQAFVGQAWQQIGSIVVSVLGIIQGTVIPILTGIGSFISTHGSEIQSILGLAWGQIQTTVGGALNLIQGLVNTVLQAVQGDWSGAWQTLQDTSAQFVTDIISVVEGGMKLLGETVALAWEGIKTAAVSLGGDTVEGIIKGVEGAAGGLFSALQDLATGALDAAKSALGIASPSKRGEEEVGTPLVQGVLRPVRNSGREAAEAMGQLTQSLLGGGQLNLAAGGGGAPGAGRGPISITLNNYGPIASNVDIENLAYEVGRVLEQYSR